MSAKTARSQHDWKTPTWAATQLPGTVAIVRIREQWWLMISSDSTVVAQPDPEEWAYMNGELGDSVALEDWLPATRQERDLALDIQAAIDADAREKAAAVAAAEQAAKHQEKSEE